MNKKISIIVPIYNVEKYIEKSLVSIINQTHKNLEIILIDDESKDKSIEICEKYIKQDKRIKIIHQKNKGLSGARNTGLENATGEYIMFIDPDDTFELNACENLYREIEKTDSDYVIANYRNMDEDDTKWKKPAFDINKYQEMEVLIGNPTKSFYVMNSGVWNKIFKKKFLDEIGIKFVEKTPAEDAIFTTYCFIKAKKVYYTPEIVYNYRLRQSDSISSNCSKEYFLGINRAYKMIYNNFKENDRLDFYRFFYAKSMNYILYKFIDSELLTIEERIDILEKMKWFYLLSDELNVPTILKSVHYIIESIVNNDYAQALKYCEILGQIRKIMSKEAKEKMSKPSVNTYKEIEDNSIDIELLERKEKLQKQMEKNQINILDIETSLKKIRDERKSVSRFGDGELDLIIGRNLKFQEHNEKLSKRLEEILKSNQNFCMIGIPDVINGFYNLTEESEEFWIRNMERTRDTWLKYIDKNREYCTANLTRLYIRYKDKSNTGIYFSIMKEIWKDRDVLIYEGDQTRVGVGNDLLDGCKSIRRVICPAEDAYEKYDEILNELKKESKETLIIIALGPTATVLAYDLAKEGYQALDMGHFDIEYEWYLRNATKKEKISNKYTNEVSGGNDTENVQDKDYINQIEKIIK